MPMKIRKNLLRDQSGVALVVALLMMIILTVIGLASIFASTFEGKLSGNKRGSTNAFYAADSGLQVSVSKIDNFNMPGKFVDNKYDPFTDPSNPNPTKAEALITFDPSLHGAPRGAGISAISFEFNHYSVQSKGKDLAEMDLVKSQCTVQEKVIRLVPTLQGGY